MRAAIETDRIEKALLSKMTAKNTISAIIYARWVATDPPDKMRYPVADSAPITAANFRISYRRASGPIIARNRLESA
jgi:hypothetical protein